jgi:EAL domain-containing protein (putative c-di-GMP-specific phosphodiesterase class I)
VQRLKESPENQLFVKTLITLANNFRVATVAEWVGDEGDADLLRSYGVNYLQGFLYGAPTLQPSFLKKR